MVRLAHHNPSTARHRRSAPSHRPRVQSARDERTTLIGILTRIESNEVIWMASSKNANKRRLRWRSKKANHGTKPNHGK